MSLGAVSLRAGGLVGAYRLTEDFRSGANGRYAVAEREGARFFVKEFPRPKYPTESIAGALRQSKLKRCRAFEDRQSRLVAALGKVCAPGGNIVMPVDFFRLNLSYYHVAPCIDTTSLVPADIGGLDIRERLFLLRLLSRSLLTLHSQAVVHGDLKPPNILIARGASGMIAPKIIDFDGAYFAGEPPEDPELLTFDQSYMAPELLTFSRAGQEATAAERRALGCAADVFSFGVLIHEYWTGRHPVLPGGVDCAAAAVMSGVAPRFEVPGMPAGVAAAMKAALTLNPRRRPSAREIDAVIAEAFRSVPVAVAVTSSEAGMGVAAGARGAATAPVAARGAAVSSPLSEVPRPTAAAAETVGHGAAGRPAKSRPGVTVRFSASLRRPGLS